MDPSLLNPPSIIIQGIQGSCAFGRKLFHSMNLSNILLAVEISPGEQIKGTSILIYL